jgi:cytochrome P450 family 150 subfamily A5
VSSGGIWVTYELVVPARAEARVCIERLLDRTTDIRIAEDKHGPAEDRRYDYVPTFILRGLTELHLEFAA